MTKIYTKTGDRGNTVMLGGERVPKSHPVMAACGSVDELNAWLGLIVADGHQTVSDENMHRIQALLFNIGSLLASPEKPPFPLPEIEDKDITELETAIDAMSEDLPPLKSFVLPGGNKNASYFHMARTVCRRAERDIVALHQEKKLKNVLIFINRLSDFLFVAARKAVMDGGSNEILWKP